MNVFEHVEMATAPKFEKALLKMTEEELLDCGSLFIRSTCTEDLQISDLPFASSSPCTSTDVINNINTFSDGTIPIFSINPTDKLPTAPMDTLPNAPVLSVPQYLDTIQPQLDAYDLTLQSCFQTLLTKYTCDVFPDPLKLKLGPQRPEDLQIVEEPGAVPVWKKVYRLSPPQVTELKAQLTKMIEAGIIWPSTSPFSCAIHP